MHGVFSRFLKKFPDSARTLRRTQTLTTVGLFLAIQMVLSSYGVIQLNDSLKISLAHLALAPTAMLFGPVAAVFPRLHDFGGAGRRDLRRFPL